MSESKDTNPKDAIAGTRLPLHLVPSTLPMFASLAFLEGALKYGAFNWRTAGVRVSVYKSAIERHLAKFYDGEWADKKTKVPHLASVLGGVGILIDASIHGKVYDDRPPAQETSNLAAALEENVKHLQDLFKEEHPHHNTQSDTPDQPGGLS